MPKSIKTSPQEILEGPILKTLLRLSVPIILAFMFHTGFNFVDRLFVSRLGDIPFAALGMSFMVQMIIVSIGSGLGIGASSLIARLIGAQKIDEANRAADQALFLVGVLAAIFTLGGPPIMQPFFQKVGASENMLPYVVGYTRIILFGAFFQFLAMMGGGILRGEGDTITPMMMMTIATIVNIVLDPLMIFGIGPFPRMGVQGAALATVIAQVVSCTILAFSFRAQRNIVKPALKIFTIHKPLLVGILVVGGPAVLSQILQPVTMGLMFFLLKTYGDASKAALTLNMTYQQIAILPVIGVAAGALTMAGQNFGARRFERLRGITLQANMTSASLMAVMAVIFITGRTAFVRVFSDSPDVISIGATLIMIASLGLPFVGARILTANILQGVGMGVRSLLVNATQMIVSVPMAWGLSVLIGLNGVWWGATLGNMLSAIFAAALIWFSLRQIDSNMKPEA